MQFTVETFETLDSTNLVIKRALEDGCAEGLVVRARRQEGGYGRQGRSWCSPNGGLYQSMLLRPSPSPSQWPTLSLVIAVAANRALAELLDLPDGPMALKWPNDGLVDGRKIMGISCEAHKGGLCVGLGINIFRPSKEPVVEGKNIPIYLEELPQAVKLVAAGPDAIAKVGESFLAAFSRAYEIWTCEGFAPFAEEYRRYCCLSGKTVKLELLSGDVLAEGIVKTINSDGLLIIETPEGEKAYNSGEVHFV